MFNPFSALQIGKKDKLSKANIGFDEIRTFKQRFPIVRLGHSKSDNSFSESDNVLFPIMVVSSLLLCVFLMASNGHVIDRSWIWPAAAVPFVLLLFRSHAESRKFKRQLETETEVLQIFSERARKKLETSESVTISINRNDIYNLTPKSKRTKTEYAKSFIEEVGSGKLYLLSAPVDSVLQPYRSQIEYRMGGILRYSTLCTRIGILGTFFGLVISLHQLSSLFSIDSVVSLLGSATIESQLPDTGASNQLQVQFVGTLSDLSFAFVTSVYGLIGSILVTWFSTSLRRGATIFYKQFTDAYSFARELVQHLTLAEPGVHASLTEVGRQLEATQNKLYDHGIRVSEAIQKQSIENNKITERFGHAADKIGSSSQRWRQAFEDFSQLPNKFSEDTDKAFERIGSTMNYLAETLTQKANDIEYGREALISTSDELKTSLYKIDENWRQHIGKLHQSMEQDRSNQHELVENLKAFEKAISSGTADINKTLARSVSKLDEFSQDLQPVTENIAKFRSSIDQFVHQMIKRPNSSVRSWISVKLFSVCVQIGILILLALIVEIEILADPLELHEQLALFLRSLKVG